jgi:hypothetical protein
MVYRQLKGSSHLSLTKWRSNYIQEYVKSFGKLYKLLKVVGSLFPKEMEIPRQIPWFDIW